MRQWIEDNQIVVAGIGVLLIIMVVAWMIFSGSEPEHTPEDQSWYFDTVEQRAFTADTRQIPPIESPWGNEAVSVFYFSCGECNETERFAGFYMKYNDETKAKLEADDELKGHSFGENFPGRMYSSDAINWVEAINVGEAGVTAALRDKCFGKLRTCR